MLAYEHFRVCFASYNHVVNKCVQKILLIGKRATVCKKMRFFVRKHLNSLTVRVLPLLTILRISFDAWHDSTMQLTTICMIPVKKLNVAHFERKNIFYLTHIQNRTKGIFSIFKWLLINLICGEENQISTKTEFHGRCPVRLVTPSISTLMEL